MLPYQAAFHWVRHRLLDAPGTTLTTEQVHDACGVACRTCQQVLGDLVRSGFLVHVGDDVFARPLPLAARSLRRDGSHEPL